MSFQLEIDADIKAKRLYFVGEQLPVDWYAAFRSWMPLAQNGDVKAQYNIGRCYARGNGTDVDQEEANVWYLKAAEQNDPRAYHNLSMLYEDEKFQKYNIEKSKYYFEKAIALGESRAIATHQKNELERKQKEEAEILLKKKNEDAAIIKSIEEALHKKDFQLAKVLLLKAIDLGYSWAFATLSALSIEFKYKIESGKSSEYNSSNIVHNGNTVVTKTTSRYYTARITIINNNNYAIDEITINSTTGLELGPILANNEIVIPRSHNGIDRFFIYIKGDEKSGKRTRSLYVPLLELIKVPESVSGSSACFVLTACFESEDAETVKKFRDFRDEYLSKSSIGRYFIKWYYENGSYFAMKIHGMPKTKKYFRKLFNFMQHYLPK